MEKYSSSSYLDGEGTGAPAASQGSVLARAQSLRHLGLGLPAPRTVRHKWFWFKPLDRRCSFMAAGTRQVGQLGDQQAPRGPHIHSASGRGSSVFRYNTVCTCVWPP